MLKRSTVMLLLIAAALGAAIYWFEIKQGIERDGAERKDHLLFPDLSPANIDALAFESADGFDATFARRENRWVMHTPVPFPANPSALDAVASALVSLSFAKEVRKPEGLSVYGLGEQARLIQFDVGGQLKALRVGSLTPTSGQTYVSRGNERRVFILPTNQLNPFNRLLLDLRDRHLVTVEAEAVTGIEIKQYGDSFVIVEQEGSWWIMSSSVPSANGVRVPEGVVDDFFSLLSGLRAEAFLDEVPAERTQALMRDGLTLRIGGEGVAVELIVETTDGEQVAVRAGYESLYLVSAKSLEALPRRLSDFRDLRIAPFDVSAAAYWELIWQGHSGESEAQVIFHAEAGGANRSWELEKGAGVMFTDEQVESWLAAASNISGTGTVVEGLGAEERRALGLEPGSVRLRVWGKAMRQQDLLADLRVGSSLLSHSSAPAETSHGETDRVLMMNALGETIHGVDEKTWIEFLENAESFRGQQ